MSKLCIGIIFGGVSHEHNISLQSAENIFNIIDRDRFSVIMIRIDKCGVWYRENISEGITFFDYLKCFVFNVLKFLTRKYRKNIFQYYLSDVGISHSNNYDDILSKVDVVFPIVHGNSGEDGTLQGFLKMQKIPFVGTGVLGSALSMDKDISKRLLRDSGLTVAPFITLNRFNDFSNINFEYCVDMLGLPLFIKPVSEGSSIGVSKVIDSEHFYYAIDLAFNLSHKVLIESAIIGRELECAVLGNKDLTVSVCGEIVLSDNFYTYEDKYSFSDNVKIIIPAQIDTEVSNKIRYVVLRAFRVLQCRGMARIDFFLTLDNCIIINEVNTLPGFTVNSMFPRLWEASGLSCKDLVSILINLALEEF